MGKGYILLPIFNEYSEINKTAVNIIQVNY